ncbi:hypothetical protein [Leifsonia xyli]|jgi:hypothetical protein|uniref:hypothetical protein n=1 Tax=Leifsonia xyli TaxID=1575 RepID=UPI000409D2E8|nr:hypothetical protein [Leifsonia xyli]
MSLQQTGQTLNDRAVTGLDTDATASFSAQHHEVTCFVMSIFVVAATADIAAYDMAIGASALAATAFAV